MTNDTHLLTPKHPPLESELYLCSASLKLPDIAPTEAASQDSIHTNSCHIRGRLLLDPINPRFLARCYERPRLASRAEPRCTSDTMNVLRRASLSRQIVLHHSADMWQVETASCDGCAEQDRCWVNGAVRKEFERGETGGCGH